MFSVRVGSLRRQEGAQHPSAVDRRAVVKAIRPDCIGNLSSIKRVRLFAPPC